jgi:predicted nuclease of predicted toxin-antitoxin system
VRILLDEQIPRDLAADLVGHEVRTVAQQKWKGLENGQLLAEASKRFDVLITMDRRMPLEREITQHRIRLVLLRAPSNRIEDLRPLVPGLLNVLTDVRPGEVRQVGA